MDSMEKGMIKMAGYMAWRGIATAVIAAAFLAGSLIYTGFYASGYTLFQKAVVVLVSLIVACALISILWMLWMRAGMRRFGGRWKKWAKTRGKSWR